MTPLRAALAAFLAAVMLLAGSLIVARMSGGAASDLVEILLAGPGGGLLCFLAALGAAAFGGLGVFTAFLAFIEREEEDDGMSRRRGFPKPLPVLFVVIALGLVWAALRCAGAPEPEAPVAVAVEPEAPPTDDLDGALQGGEPVFEAADAAPAVSYGEAGFDWAFKDPLIRARGAVWLSGGRPFADEASGETLCGKAWVAVTGSASEEGPAARNAERARLRAAAGAEAARRWIARHPACGETHVFGIDLGQHAAGSPDDTGAATAYQRRVLVMARDRREGETMTVEAARAELAGYLADPASRAALLGGRRFPAEPVILPP